MGPPGRSPDTSRGRSSATHPAAADGTECYPLPLADPTGRSVTDPIAPGGPSNPWPSVPAAPPDPASAPRSNARARRPASPSPFRRSASPTAHAPSRDADPGGGGARRRDRGTTRRRRALGRGGRAPPDPRATCRRGTRPHRLDRGARRGGVRLRHPRRQADRADRWLDDPAADRALGPERGRRRTHRRLGIAPKPFLRHRQVGVDRVADRFCGRGPRRLTGISQSVQFLLEPFEFCPGRAAAHLGKHRFASVGQVEC